MRNVDHFPRFDDPLPLVDVSATAQATLVRSGQRTVEDLREAAITRIARLNPKLNALSGFDLTLARQATPRGNGPFTGVPTLLKDLLAYPGLPVAFGSRLLAGNVAQAGSPYTDALDAAGLVVIGKTATSEFGLIGTTEPLANGATHNPWDLRCSPGGSSGGAVAAVAAGMVPVAHASDGGGSIRGPASLCGVFGFKPSRGRTRSTGLPPEMPTAKILSDHCVSRTVEDSAVWLQVTEVSGSFPALEQPSELATPGKRLRIGYYHRDIFGEQPHDDAREALEMGIRICTDLGHQLVACDGPQIDASAKSPAFYDLTAVTITGMVQQMAQAMGPMFKEELLEPCTRSLLVRARDLSPTRIAQATEELANSGPQVDQALTGFDALLSPTVPYAAFELGRYSPQHDPEKLRLHNDRIAGYTVPASLAGWPAMSVPLYWNANGLPIGCHFATAHGNDALLFRLAFELERAAPWIGRLNALSHTLLK